MNEVDHVLFFVEAITDLMEEPVFQLEDEEIRTKLGLVIGQLEEVTNELIYLSQFYD